MRERGALGKVEKWQWGGKVVRLLDAFTYIYL